MTSDSAGARRAPSLSCSHGALENILRSSAKGPRNAEGNALIEAPL